MKKGQNYYKRMAVDCILDKMDMSCLVDLYNRMDEDTNGGLHVFLNTAMELDEEVLPMRGAWEVLTAAMKGYWTEGDIFVYVRETQRGTELHSFSRLIDKDCPIYLSEIADWLERNDWLPLEEIYTRDDYSYEVENAFRMFAEEDEGFSPVGIGIYIGEHGGIDLYENWDNCIIDMFER